MNRLLSRVPVPLHDWILNSTAGIARYWPHRPSSATVRVQKFAGDDGSWFRFATAAALRWKPQQSISGISVVRIHGDRDKTFPRGYEFADHVIGGAGHLLAISHADALAKIVAEHRNGQNKIRLDEKPAKNARAS